MLKKEELKLLREKAIEENRKRAEEAEQLRRERKQEEEREAVRQQIEVGLGMCFRRCLELG